MISMVGGEHFKTIRDAFSNDMQIHNLKRSYARDMLGIGDKLSVIDIVYEDGDTTYKQLLSFEEIISIYLDNNEDVAKRMTIDRFFVFLYNKNILQYPIVRKAENYYRPENWRAFIDETEVVSFLRNRYEQNDNVALKSYGFNAMLGIVSSTKWQKLSDIKDEDLLSIEKFVQEYTQINKKKQSYITTVLSDLRLSLIILANNDKALLESQMRTYYRLISLMTAFAKVGIDAMVDEITGYQEDRRKDELEKILRLYISEEFLEWTKMFPEEFYEQIFRLKKWGSFQKAGQKMPQVVGLYTNDIVYERLPDKVLVELKKKVKKSENGNNLVKLHQGLSKDYGVLHLERHLIAVIALMKASTCWEHFLEMLDKTYKRFGQSVMRLY
ncbi:P63C domain-containing protein [Aliarcobacter cryaerophilus]|uniref:P63C domain-containing protein n=1 Tax=Aliarcobacter cryaerophilus TaxID=28198 RepID=UPI0021B43EF8|nr:P63C domain-containing protein [Aliarcobacter cryaerophilus]MCT7500346.1 P63C domain-containing protein [Aliarcobacter cryaerophilus]MCT7544660.1 P63C domain-containing protein [Aliarcobacter cryaerophilus]